MKKVLYVVPGLNPNNKDGASNRCESFINCFADNGYDVTCLALTYLKDYKNALNHKSEYTSKAKWKILPYLFFLDNYNKNILLIFIKLYVYILNQICKFDFVLVDYASGADVVSWLKGKLKIIVNYRGDQIDEHIMIHNCDQNCPSVRTLKRLISKSVDLADYSICVSEALRVNIETYAGKVLTSNFIFPCCADVNRFVISEKMEFKDRFVLGYFGGLSKWQCVDYVIDYAIKLNNIDKRYFLLLLTNSNTESIQDRLNLLGPDNYMIKSVGFSEIPRWLSLLDMSFNLRENRPLNIVSSPTKLSESLASGVPVVVTEYSGDYREIIKDGVTGLVLPDLEVTDENVSLIHSFMLRIHENNNMIRKACRSQVVNRTWKQYTLEFIKFIEQSCK